MNIEHNAANTVDGYMLETWIIEDNQNDKVLAFLRFAFEDV
mgnify:CR=1 FL=1